MFAWSSLLYVFMLVVFLFGALSIFLVYFIILSIFGQGFDPVSLGSIGAYIVITLLFLFFTSGLNAALAKAFHSALSNEKTSLIKFYSYAIDKAPEMFAIMLTRDLVWLLLAGPGIAVYIYFLSPYQYMDAAIGIYVLAVTFIVHMLFTPAFLSAGTFGTDVYSSLRHALHFIVKRHVFFLVMFVIFAIVWLLSFIPFIQLVTLFFAYPVVYSAMIIMLEKEGGE